MTRKRTRRKAATAPNLFTLGLDAWLVGAEAAGVMALRASRIALGGAAGERETKRMLAEKAESAWELGLAFATGGLGLTPDAVARGTLAHYGKRVRANRRRLSRAG
jgi:hypothetical protein